MTRYPSHTIPALEDLIDRYGLLAVLQAISDVCDLNAERTACQHQNIGLAMAWAVAQHHVSETQQQIRTLDL